MSFEEYIVGARAEAGVCKPALIDQVDAERPLQECTVCLEEYQEPPSMLAPTSLPCGHTVCKGCSEHLSGGSPLTVVCPTCQYRCEIPPSGLPCNYAVIEVINILSPTSHLRLDVDRLSQEVASKEAQVVELTEAAAEQEALVEKWLELQAAAATEQEAVNTMNARKEVDKLTTEAANNAALVTKLQAAAEAAAAEREQLNAKIAKLEGAAEAAAVEQQELSAIVEVINTLSPKQQSGGRPPHVDSPQHSNGAQENLTVQPYGANLVQPPPEERVLVCNDYAKELLQHRFQEITHLKNVVTQMQEKIPTYQACAQILEKKLQIAERKLVQATHDLGNEREANQELSLQKEQLWKQLEAAAEAVEDLELQLEAAAPQPEVGPAVVTFEQLCAATNGFSHQCSGVRALI